MSKKEFDPFSTGEFESMKDKIMAGVEVPESFSAEDYAAEQLEGLGVPGMEQELNALKDDLRNQEAMRRARMGTARSEVSRMGAIEGRLGEIERQEGERIDTINRMIAYKQDQLGSAYGAIEFMINLKQIDFDNGMKLYSTQLDASLNIYKQLRSEFESDRTFDQALIQDQRDHATATLQIYTNLITSGNLTYEGLDSSTKTQLKKLEVQSGLGIGFTSNLRMKPGENIKSITQRDDADGYTYANILTVQPDGSLKLTKQRLGKFYVAPKSAPKGPSASEIQTEKLAQATSKVSQGMSAGQGGDGKVSPTIYNANRSYWDNEGGNVLDFDDKYGGFINDEHYWNVAEKKWGGAQYHVTPSKAPERPEYLD